MTRPPPRTPATLLASGTLLAGLLSAVVLSSTGPAAGKPFTLAVAPATDPGRGTPASPGSGARAGVLMAGARA